MNSLLLFINMLLVMTHTQPQLPYAMDALAPYMSQETLEYHYGKHLKAYVDNVNKMIPNTVFENATLDEIVMKAEGPLFNNAAQVWNHNLFFLSFSPKAKEAPEGALLEAINRDFGSLDAFKEQFEKAAVALFGSGWTWLAVGADGKLQIISESNAGNPLRKGLKTLMGVDVWEHSYYIDYRNRRADYLKAFWKILDWKTVEDRYTAK